MGKRWTCSKIKKKKSCDLNDLNGNPLWKSCPVSCDKCGDDAMKSEQESAVESNNANNDNVFHHNDDGGRCEDDFNYRFKNIPARDCQWVFDNNKCEVKDKKNGSLKAKYWCPSICDTGCSAN